MTARPAKGGGRRVAVPPERLNRWIDGFAARHGPFEATGSTTEVRLVARDGAVATFSVPFPPLRAGGRWVSSLVTHAQRRRVLGVVLVRMGGYAAGVFDGADLVASKVGSRLVQGRTAAGGWSQQRFARRRANQADKAFEAAADTVVRVVVPRLGELEGVVFGGDRKAVDALRADRRLAGVFDLETGPFLTVPDPRLAVLQASPEQFRAVTVHIAEPAEAPEHAPGLERAAGPE
ncbi:acVLRF1 family peptidyl-tRNA hydrolase [Nonomuraea sp. NPDC050556]|uniref:acVLRF1 family peptidyl-tRNA hydrolase n=1 Tax=Nonomuraea sp. NPDC050556 TaxID=3364369 RepID=UPI0037AE9472